MPLQDSGQHLPQSVLQEINSTFAEGMPAEGSKIVEMKLKGKIILFHNPYLCGIKAPRSCAAYDRKISLFRRLCSIHY